MDEYKKEYYNNLIGKNIKCVLTSSNGYNLFYSGKLIKVLDDEIVLIDYKAGTLLLKVSNLSITSTGDSQ